MKKYILLLMLAVTAFVGCKKDENNSPVAPCQKGTIQVVNQSEFHFDVWSDNKQVGQVTGKKTLEFELSNGSYFIQLIQFNGYVVAPKMHEQTVTVEGCKTVVLTIPKTNSEQ